MFKRVLVANRGEIALRIVRALKELGIESVVVFSEADADSLAVKFADKAVCIGPPDPSQSYLNIQAILSACNITGAEAVHPGYGFLAENPSFAELCRDVGVVFIGPSPEHIEVMGDKLRAIKAAKEAGVSVVPGSLDEVESLDEALAVANDIGYPVMVKAAFGGGGRGMRLVKNDDELERVWEAARREAVAGFGSAKVYIEKFIEDARHIEVQVIADKYGNVLHLGERECSIQRRHQKLLEEAPAAIPNSVKERLWSDAVKLAEHVGYESAGTVEFLVDRDGNHYFIEMNTRVQVEHPVTEMITGVDIVKWQVMIAAGERLPYTQDDIKFSGWAMEFRINAEDPTTFTPSPGKITKLVFPGGPGVRIDSAVYEGYEIPPYYDSMVAKLIVHADTRIDAIKRGIRALSETVIDGVKTTVPLHLAVLKDEDFVNGNISVEWLEARL